MKKGFILVFFVLSACFSGTNNRELKIFNWISYVPQDVYDDFTEETGIKIIEDALTSNEEMYAKVQLSATYDIVVPSLNFVQLMIDEGLVVPFDKTQIPNYTNIDPLVLQKIAGVDPNQEYLVPFAYGPAVIAYDTTVVTEDVKGFEIFENPKYKGRSSMLNDMREIMVPALVLNGIDDAAYDDKSMAIATEQISKWKQNILRFDSDYFYRAFSTGEISLVHGFGDTLWANMSPEKRKTTKIIIPEKGATAYIDSMMILKQSQNKEAAMQFMNFIHRPDIYARIIDFLGTPNINVPARSLTKEKEWISFEELKKAYVVVDIGNEAMTVQARVWEDIQAQ